MRRLLLHWAIMAIAVWLTSRIVPGVYVTGVAAALIAAIVIGLVNATIGMFLKIITFPLTILTLGIFWLILNAAMLELASAFVPGFRVRSFGAAFWGAIVLSLANMLLKRLIEGRRQ
jgi:putative membrane protein